MERATKATTEAEHARAATGEFWKGAETMAAQLAAEWKRKEDLEAKVGASDSSSRLEWVNWRLSVATCRTTSKVVSRS